MTSTTENPTGIRCAVCGTSSHIRRVSPQRVTGLLVCDPCQYAAFLAEAAAARAALAAEKGGAR